MNIVELSHNGFQRDSKEILKNVSWTIKKGEHWALVGPNGAGKTTLLKIVSGNLWPSSGKVKVLGREFGKTDLRGLRKKIGWASSYLSEKIPENEKAAGIVLSGKHSSFGIFDAVTESDRKEAEKLLGFMGCHGIKDRPFRLMSQGEKQKVIIARALMARPMILILDEPCSGLDPAARKNVLASVSQICKGGKTTVIYVTHHFEEIVGEIENILMLKDGGVFMRGKAGEVLNNGNIDKLFG